LAEKVEGKKTYFLSSFPSISLHAEPKNTIKIVSKIRLKNLKKSQKKKKGRYVGVRRFFFLLFLWRSLMRWSLVAGLESLIERV
jgi:hypothetical protein